MIRLGATYSFSMLMVGAHWWLRSMWKSGRGVNPKALLSIEISLGVRTPHADLAEVTRVV